MKKLGNKGTFLDYSVMYKLNDQQESVVDNSLLKNGDIMLDDAIVICSNESNKFLNKNDQAGLLNFYDLTHSEFFEIREKEAVFRKEQEDGNESEVGIIKKYEEEKEDFKKNNQALSRMVNMNLQEMNFGTGSGLMGASKKAEDQELLSKSNQVSASKVSVVRYLTDLQMMLDGGTDVKTEGKVYSSMKQLIAENTLSKEDTIENKKKREKQNKSLKKVDTSLNKEEKKALQALKNRRIHFMQTLRSRLCLKIRYRQETEFIRHPTTDTDLKYPFQYHIKVNTRI